MRRWLLGLAGLGAGAVALHRLSLRPVRRVQPLLLDGRSPGLALDCRVLEACGCSPRLLVHDLFPPPSYLLGAGRESLHLFLERVPWWARLLPRARCQVLWNHELPTTQGNLGCVGRILCKTRVACDLAPGPAEFVGFTSRPERGALPEPAACRATGFLHLAGQSEHKGTAAVLEAWHANPDLPLLVAPLWGKALAKVPRRLRRPAHNLRLHGRLPAAEVERLQSGLPFHLLPSAGEGFGHTLDEARRAGAVVITTDAEPMRRYGNVLVPARPAGRLHRVSASDVAAAARRALALPDREALGRENQRRFSEEQERFLVSFAERVRGIVGGAPSR